MSDAITKWHEAVQEIGTAYSEVDRRSLSIPGFSLAPFGIFFWSNIKFTVFFYLDLLLFVPVNLVILVRNIFPGRWRHRSFSGRYFKAVIHWLGNGEVPIVATVAIRSMVSAFLASHFRSRLNLIRHRVVLEVELPEEDQAKLVAAVDKLLLRWPAQTPWNALFTYGLPLLSPVGALYQLVFPGAPSLWTKLLIAVSLSYALGFVSSAFMIKRGLMMGGIGRSAYFPGFIEGRGAYAVEEKTLTTFGLAVKEFPLGFVLSLILIPVSYAQALLMYETGLYSEMAGIGAVGKAAYLAESTSGAMLVVLLGVIAMVRRRRLGRC